MGATLSKTAIMETLQEGLTTIATITTSVAWNLVSIDGGMTVDGMINATLLVSFHGKIMSNASKKARNMDRKKMKDSNVIMLTLKTKTIGNAIGKTLDVLKLLEMHAGIHFSGTIHAMEQSQIETNL